MSKTYGVDISHWEGHIDWAIASQYVNFCLMKATDGDKFTDPEFASNKAGCMSFGVPWGAYHYFQPTKAPGAQAAHFVQVVGDDCNVYVVDVEQPFLESLAEGGDIDVMVEGYPALLKDFLDEVERLTGKKCMIYTSPGFWNYLMIPTPGWCDDFDLWVAHWGVQEPMLPNGFTSWVIHQYSDDGDIDGIPGACDEDWFNGSLQDVNAYFGIPEPPEPPPLHLVEIIASTLRMRDKPYGTIVGYLKNGNVLLVTKSEFFNGKEWYYSGPYCFASWWTKVYFPMV